MRIDCMYLVLMCLYFKYNYIARQVLFCVPPTVSSGRLIERPR